MAFPIEELIAELSFGMISIQATSF